MLWQQLSNIWPLDGNTKEKWAADIRIRTQNHRFACPSVRQCTTNVLPSSACIFLKVTKYKPEINNLSSMMQQQKSH